MPINEKFQKKKKKKKNLITSKPARKRLFLTHDNSILSPPRQNVSQAAMRNWPPSGQQQKQTIFTQNRQLLFKIESELRNE